MKRVLMTVIVGGLLVLPGLCAAQKPTQILDSKIQEATTKAQFGVVKLTWEISQYANGKNETLTKNDQFSGIEVEGGFLTSVVAFPAGHGQAAFLRKATFVADGASRSQDLDLIFWYPPNAINAELYTIFRKPGSKQTVTAEAGMLRLTFLTPATKMNKTADGKYQRETVPNAYVDAEALFPAVKIGDTVYAHTDFNKKVGTRTIKDVHFRNQATGQDIELPNKLIRQKGWTVIKK